MTLQRLELIALLTVLALVGPARLSFAQEAAAPAHSQRQVAEGDTVAEIARAQAHLDELLLKYTDKHPDVIAARLKVAELKQRRAKELECFYPHPEFEFGWTPELARCYRFYLLKPSPGA